MYSDDDQSYLQQLPRIGATHTSIAALMNQSRTNITPFPRGMPIGGIIDKGSVRVMIAKHAETVQDAYAACHGLTVLTSEKQKIKHLIDAENCELEHASLGTKPLDDSLPARSVSIVGLVTGQCATPGHILVSMQWPTWQAPPRIDPVAGGLLLAESGQRRDGEHACTTTAATTTYGDNVKLGLVIAEPALWPPEHSSGTALG